MSARLTTPATLALLSLLASAAQADTFTEDFDAVVDPNGLDGAWFSARQAPGGVHEITVTSSGEWMVVSDPLVERSAGFPYLAAAYVDWYRYWGRQIDAVAVSPQGGVVVSAEDMLYVSHSGIPARSLLYNQLDLLRDNGVTIEDIAFDPDGFGWAIAAGADSVAFSVNEALIEALDDAADGERPVHGISMGSGGRFAVLAGDWFHLQDGSFGLHDTLGLWQRTRNTLDHVVLGPDGFELASSTGTYAPTMTPLDQIDGQVLPGFNIWRRMNQLGVSGVSIAVVDGDEILSRSYGYADTEELRHLTPGTPIEAASLSKAVASMGMLALADNSLLSMSADLTQDIVPALDPSSDFVKYLERIDNLWLAPPDGIEIRMLLDHTAGLNYNSGSASDLMVKGDRDLFWLLRGWSCNPFNQSCGTGPWTGMNLNATPGSTYNYSATGYLFAQAVMEGVTGAQMEDVMDAMVLAPLGMGDTTFDTQFVADNPGYYSYTHASDGLPIKGSERSAYRWLGAGGMYSTPRDLGRFLQTVDAGGTSPDGVFVVSEGAIEQMLTASDQNPNYALGIRRTTCDHSVETDRPGEIWHGGRHVEVLNGRTAAIRHTMRYRPGLDQGIVVMVNGGGVNSFVQNGVAKDAALVLRDEIVARFRQVYGWTNSACTQVPLPTFTPTFPGTPSGPGGTVTFP